MIRRIRPYFWSVGEPWRSIRAWLVPQLLRAASEHAEWEDFSRMRLAEGGDLRKYYPLSAEARGEYEEWRKAQES